MECFNLESSWSRCACIHSQSVCLKPVNFHPHCIISCKVKMLWGIETCEQDGQSLYEGQWEFPVEG